MKIENDPAGTVGFRWTRAEDQFLWIRIGVAFLVFYLCEAILFWRGGLTLAAPLMRLPGSYPLIYPLGYWGLFGVAVYFLQRRKSSQADPVATRFRRWQRGIATAVITAGVIGPAFAVIVGSGSVTLGHVALFFALFLSAGVIGAMDLNVGWLAAAGLWLFTALLIDFYPAGLHLTGPIKDEDAWVGLAVAVGFFLVGAFPQHVDRRWLDARENGKPVS
jgi:hypothetical protein